MIKHTLDMNEYIKAGIDDYLKEHNKALTEEQFKKVLMEIHYYIMSTLSDSIEAAMDTIK